MSAITDVGVNFSFKGGQDFESRLKVLESQWKSFHDTMQKTPEVNKHFDKVSGSVAKMARSIVESMSVAKIAIAGFLAAKGIEGLANWMGTGSGIGKAQDYKRRTGATEAEIDAVGKLGTKLNKTLAGFDKEKFEWGTYDIQSAHAKDSLEKRLKVMEDVAYLAKMFESGDYREASTFYKTMWAGFGQFLPEKDQAGFSGQVMSGLQTALSQTGANSNQIKAAMEQAAPIYSQLNYSWAKAMADTAILSNALGSGEKAGTALRNLSSRGGESYGKLYEALAKTRYQGATGQRYWDMTEEDQRLFDKGKAYDFGRKTEEGARLMREDPVKYWLQVNKMIQEIKRDKQADVAGILGTHGFGDESLTAAMVMAKVMETGEYQRVLKTFQSLDPDKSKQNIEGSQKSFSSAWELFEQKFHEFQKNVRKTIEPFLREIIEPYGNMFTRISEMWGQSIKGGVMVDLKMAWDSFWSEFKGGAGFSGIEETFTNLIKTMSTYSPQDWIELGRQWGEWATVKFDGLVSSLKEIGEALKNIAALAKTANEWLGTPEDKRKTIETAQTKITAQTSIPEQQAIVDAQNRLEKEGTGMGMFWPAVGGLKKGIWGVISGMAWEATVNGPYNPALHGDVPYEYSNPGLQAQKITGPRQVPNFARGDGLGNPITVTQQHENVIQLDGEEIARKVAPKVTEIVKDNLPQQRISGYYNSLDETVGFSR